MYYEQLDTCDRRLPKARYTACRCNLKNIRDETLVERADRALQTWSTKNEQLQKNMTPKTESKKAHHATLWQIEGGRRMMRFLSRSNAVATLRKIENRLPRTPSKKNVLNRVTLHRKGMPLPA